MNIIEEVQLRESLKLIIENPENYKHLSRYGDALNASTDSLDKRNGKLVKQLVNCLKSGDDKKAVAVSRKLDNDVLANIAHFLGDQDLRRLRVKTKKVS